MVAVLDLVEFRLRQRDETAAERRLAFRHRQIVNYHYHELHAALEWPSSILRADRGWHKRDGEVDGAGEHVGT